MYRAAGWGLCCWLSCLAAVAGSGRSPDLVSTDFNHAGSLSAGIQEALDALPPGGGRVYVPAGEHVLYRSLILPHGTVLHGAGRGSIIRKSPNFRVMLAADALQEEGLDYVTVEDPAALQAGMYVVLMDARQLMGGGRVWGEVKAVDGNKVYLRQVSKSTGTVSDWKPGRDFLVERNACLMHVFGLVAGGARGSVLRDLAFDGNKDQQQIDGRDFWEGYHPHTVRNSRGLPYLAGGALVERCYVYDAAQVNISISRRATIVNSEIWGAAQGIHPGAGPDARIVGNVIRDNWESGIFMCMGNHGIVIAENHIFRNGTGIDALGTRTLGTAEEPLRRDGDHYCIIAHNVIYDNMRAGIGGHQGEEGAEDFIITGNIIYNNFLGYFPESRPVLRTSLPAGISLYNAKRCVITNNRIFDDQQRYETELFEEAVPGDRRLRVRNIPSVPICDAVPFEHPRYAVVHGEDGPSGILQITAGSARTYAHVTLNLAEPLADGFPAGARVQLVQSQAWGIVVAGPHARDNLIANNSTLGNRVGGILWEGPGSQVAGNLGRVSEIDGDRPLADLLFTIPQSPEDREE